MKKICIICGAAFEAVQAKQNVCGPECRRIRSLVIMNAWRARAREKKPPTLRVCAYCGAAFTVSCHTRNYCSPVCANKANRENYRALLKLRKESARTASVCKKHAEEHQCSVLRTVTDGRTIEWRGNVVAGACAARGRKHY